MSLYNSRRLSRRLSSHSMMSLWWYTFVLFVSTHLQQSPYHSNHFISTNHNTTRTTRLSLFIPTHQYYPQTKTQHINISSQPQLHSVLSPFTTPGWIPISELFSAVSTNSPLSTLSSPIVPRIVSNLLRVSVSLCEHPHNHHHPLSISSTTQIIPMNDALWVSILAKRNLV